MAPPNSPKAATAAKLATFAKQQRVADVAIPNHLRPQWRDLPALAWLAVRRLDTNLQAVPVLGRAAAWCATPLMLLTLFCANANGHLAARNRQAVIWIRRLSSTGRGIHTIRELVIVAGFFLPLATTMLFAAAIGTAEQTAPPKRIVALAITATAAVGPMLAIFAINRWRDLTTRTSPQHRRLAASTSVPLVVVQGFVADTTTRAGVALVRTLRTHADRLGVGVVAIARDEHLLHGYRANGFILTEPDPASRMLYRRPYDRVRSRQCDNDMSTVGE